TTVVSGAPEAVDALVSACAADNVFARAVQVSVASHSPQVDGLLAPLRAALDSLRPQPPAVPFWSTVDGGPRDAALDADYWCANLREVVAFAPTIGALLSRGPAIFVEISPHPVLQTALEQCCETSEGSEAVVVAACQRGRGQASTLEALARLWVAGASPRWSTILGRAPARALLPPTPFDRTRHWIEARARG
ncbi:MAG: acyltransferase domain-containing protein, partial [Mycobacterium sp.]|nr:acyltransferase domain-containing protein [Mycobacterium sp.]